MYFYSKVKKIVSTHSIKVLPIFLFCLNYNICAQSINIETWYLPLEEDNNYSLYITEFGQGEPVFVLHGGFGAEHSYLVDILCQQEF